MDDVTSEPELWDRVEALIGAGQIPTAVELLENAAASDDRRLAAVAALQGARIHLEYGGADDARKWYERAVASNEPDVVPNAAFELGSDLDERDRHDDAEAAFAEALNFRGEAAAASALRLAQLQLARGDEEASRITLRFAVAAEDAAVTPLAALLLGQLIEQRENFWGAAILYTQAMESGHALASGAAAWRLGHVRAETGNQSGARDAWRIAQSSSDGFIAADASLRLAEASIQLEDWATAREAYAQALESGVREVIEEAALDIALLAREGGRPDEAQRILDAVKSEIQDRVAETATEILEDVLRKSA
jgi:predicted negative regulator of RcsB-dependent stress response